MTANHFSEQIVSLFGIVHIAPLMPGSHTQVTERADSYGQNPYQSAEIGRKFGNLRIELPIDADRYGQIRIDRGR
jgi:hypothetical protein